MVRYDNCDSTNQDRASHLGENSAETTVMIAGNMLHLRNQRHHVFSQLMSQAQSLQTQDHAKAGCIGCVLQPSNGKSADAIQYSIAFETATHCDTVSYIVTHCDTVSYIVTQFDILR